VAATAGEDSSLAAALDRGLAGQDALVPQAVKQVLLVGRVEGTAFPHALLPAAGLALMIVAAAFFTLADATAELAAPAVVAASSTATGASLTAVTLIATVVGVVVAEISTGLAGGIGRLIIEYAREATSDPAKVFTAVFGAAALGLARSLAGWLAGRRPPASAGVEVTTRRVTVVQHADTTVLVHRVETALVVRTLEVARVWSADDERCPAARDNSGK
jgi:hypothetical protein